MFTWMTIENTVVIEKKPVTRDSIFCDYLYVKRPEQANPQKQRTDQWFPRAGLEVTTNGYGISLRDNENVLELDHSDGYTTVNILKTEWYTIKGELSKKKKKVQYGYATL